MKNLKVRGKLLVGFGTIVVLLICFVFLSFLGMNHLNKQNQILIGETMPNIDLVWNMRKSMVSLQRNLLIGVASDVREEVFEATEMIEIDTNDMSSLFQDYQASAKVDSTLIDAFAKQVDKINTKTKTMLELLKLDTAVSRSQAFQTYQKEFKPMLNSSDKTLVEIANQEQVIADNQVKQAKNVYNSTLITLICASLLSVGITIFMIRRIIKYTTEPLEQLECAMKTISDGNFDVSIDYISKDEFGILAQRMRTAVDTLKSIIMDIKYCLDEMGEGNFTVDSNCKEKYVGDYSTILDSIEQIKDRLSVTLIQINDSSAQLLVGSKQVSDGAQALAQGSTEQASAVEQLSATIRDVSQQINDTAVYASDSNKLSKETESTLGLGIKQMEQMMSAMGQISDCSTEINKIIKTIDDIAFKTNILALNAAVEAARAGQAGKGFAVVADEVKNLAQKSAEAAKGTTHLIEKTIDAVENGYKIAVDTEKTIKLVATNTNKVLNSSIKISAASEKQALSMNQVTTGVDQISGVVQTNSATAQQSAAASEELRGQADFLKGLVAQFRVKQYAINYKSSVEGNSKGNTTRYSKY